MGDKAIEVNSEDALRQKIINEVKKSGFPLEIYATTILKKRGWLVQNNVNYFNERIEDYKEIDIIAEKIGSFLVVECKKSDAKPWIFFKQNEIVITLREVINIAAFNETILYQAVKDLSELQNILSPICEHYIVAYLSQQNENSLKNKENDIHKAVNQVIDALSFYFEKELSRVITSRSGQAISLLPMIIFDGKLVSASVEEKEIRIEEVPWVMLCVTRENYKRREKQIFGGKTDVYERKKYLIPIIKKEHLADYLDLTEKKEKV